MVEHEDLILGYHFWRPPELAWLNVSILLILSCHLASSGLVLFIPSLSNLFGDAFGFACTLSTHPRVESLFL
eukprot:g61016.t1